MWWANRWIKQGWKYVKNLTPSKNLISEYIFLLSLPKIFCPTVMFSFTFVFVVSVKSSLLFCICNDDCCRFKDFVDWTSGEPTVQQTYSTIPTIPHLLYHTNITLVLYHIIPYLATPCHTIPYHTIPYLTIPHLTTPLHTLPYHIIPFHTKPYHTLTHTHGAVQLPPSFTIQTLNWIEIDLFHFSIRIKKHALICIYKYLKRLPSVRIPWSHPRPVKYRFSQPEYPAVMPNLFSPTNLTM